MSILGRPFWVAQYLVCVYMQHTCDKYVTRRDQPQVVRQHNYTGKKIFCSPSGSNRGTRPDPKKVNLAQVEFLFLKRGPTTFAFIP